MLRKMPVNLGAKKIKELGDWKKNGLSNWKGA